MSERTNSERMQTAVGILYTYASRMLQEHESQETNLVDLLTDLRHAFLPSAFAEALHLSEIHYNSEKET